MESSIWDLPIVNKNELYLLDAIVHKVKEGETLYGDIIPKYYKEYLNTKQKIKLPTFGYSNDMSDLETFKFDLVHTILEMNNLIHPRMIPSNKNIFLPNFEFKDVVKNGCNYAVKNEKQIGLWTVKDPNTGLVVSKLENIEIFIRTESDWKILMDTEWLDDSIELAVLTSGLLALATYNDSELTKAKECGDDGFIFIRRPNLLELRNIFNALFYEKVDLPNHFFERSTRYFPSTIVVAKFIEKFIPIFLRMDSFIFNNFDTIDNRVFISKNIKALAEQSADLISNDLLIKSILSGSISSFIKGIIIKVSLDINYFSEKHLLKVTSSERKKIKEVKVDLSLGSKVLIKNSLIVYGITNNIYKKKVNLRKDIISQIFDNIVDIVPYLKTSSKAIKTVLKTVVKPLLVDTIINLNSVNYDKKLGYVVEDMDRKLEKLTRSKIISEETWDDINLAIGTALDRVQLAE